MPDLAEECDQIPLALDLLASRPDQHAARQHGEHADDLGLRTDRWRLVLGTQQAAVLERREVGGDPGLLVRRKVLQRHARRGVGEHRLAQHTRIGALARNEFRPRHRCGCGKDIEAKRCEQRHALVRNLLVRRGLERLQHLDDRSDAHRLLWRCILECLEQAGDREAELGTQRRGVGAGRSQRLQSRDERLSLGHRPEAARILERCTDRCEITVDQRLQPRIRRDGEAHADIAAGDHIHRVAGCQHVAVAVDLRIQADPRHILAHPVGCPADVARIAQVRQPVDLRVLAELGHTELEVHVRRIDVGQALQRDAVESGLACRDDTRTTQADRDIDRQRALDQETVRQRRLGTVGIQDAEVIEPLLAPTQVEGGDDPRRIDHLVAHGLDFLDPRAHQLQQRLLVEARAPHLDRDPAAVAALVHLHVGDLEGQRLGLHLDQRLIGTGEFAHQYVVGTSLRTRYQRLLVGLQWRLEGRIVVRAVRQCVVAHEDLVCGRALVRLHADAQRLAGADRDLEQACLASPKCRGRRHAEHQLGYVDFHRIGRGAVVVVLVRRLMDLVEDVRAHDDPVLAIEHRRNQHIRQLGLVACTGCEPTRMRDPPEQAIRQIPVAICREIDRVAPDALRRVVTTVADRPAERDCTVDGATRRHRDRIDHQVCRRWQLDQQRLHRGACVVSLASRLEHRTVGAAPRDHIGQHEHVIVAVHAGRQAQWPDLLVVALAGSEAARMHDLPEVTVGIDVEELVGRQVDAVDPAVLQHRRITRTAVLDPVRELEGLPGKHPLGDIDIDHTQIRCGAQVDVQCGRRDVVALATVLLDRVTPHMQSRHLRDVGDAAVDQHAGHIGIGVDQHVVVAVDAFGQREVQRAVVARAGIEVALALELADQQVGGIQRCILRQEHPVVPAPFTRLPCALVADREARRDRAARVRRLWFEHQVGDHQVRFAVDDLCHRGTRVVRKPDRLPRGGHVVSEGILVATPLVLRIGQHADRAHVGEHVDEERPLHTGRQGELGACRITLTGTQRGGVVMHDRAEKLRTRAIEGRVGGNPHGIQPVARTGPDGSPLVLDRPGDLGLLAREVRRRCNHLDHAQVRRCGRHICGGGARVVVLDRLCQRRRVGRVGGNDDVPAVHGGRQIETLLHRVAAERVQLLRTLEAAECPHPGPRHGDIGHVGYVDGVDP